ncbi:MAG: hypothetical protein ACREDC_03570 [Bradyrhizobium sp.]
MRASTAFFAGMGTVVVAIASGVSGGAWIADMMSPGLHKQVTETAHRHRRALSRPMSASGMVPYAAATLAFSDPSIDHGAAAQDRFQPKTDVVKKQISPAVQSAGTAAANGPSAKSADAPSSKAVTTAARRLAAGTRDADLNRATGAPGRYRTDRHRYQPRAAQDQHRQQQSRQAGRRRSSGRTSSGQRYPGGRYRDESSAKYRAADRRYHDEPDSRYRQYDSRPRYAERPAPFALPPTGLFGPD